MNKHRIEQLLEKLQLRLATVDTLPQLALLGIISGLLTGLVIIVFRILIEFPQAALMPDGQSEHYETLPWFIRLSLPVIGGLAIGLLYQFIARGANQVGVIHVMERLAYHQGRLPLRNAVWQFIGAALAIISGHSVGREGPSVHLGATCGSQLGQQLKLPNNSTRILVSCGIAAAIASSFNTPLAGVIFSMEVVMMEYTLTGFIPVILAAVSATIICRWMFGADAAFTVPPLELGSLYELPYVLFIGILIGILATAFIHLIQQFSYASSNKPLWQRTTLAGIIIGLCALVSPEIMGIGYDTVNAALLGQIGMALLLMIVIFKIIATAAAVGLGIPGGLIGPSLFIGAAAGGALGMVADMIFPGGVSSYAFYAMIGMGAMMGATLQAPLAALVALLELTSNPNIILPGMLAIVAASLTSSEWLGKQSVFILLMKARGLDYRNNPVAQSLRRLSVTSVMNKHIAISDRNISLQAARVLLTGQPQWIVITEEGEPKALLPAADLVQYLQNQNTTETDQQEMIDLREFPAKRRQLATIHIQANLQEAFDTLTDSGAEALCVTHKLHHQIRVDGILTQQDIEEHYLYRG